MFGENRKFTMWIKIENKLINLNTGIVIEVLYNPIERKWVIRLERVGYDEKGKILFGSKNKKEVDKKFKQIESLIYKTINIKE